MEKQSENSRTGALYGSLDVMVLKTLSERAPLHGLDIARSIEARSGEYLRVEEGALYPALHRLQRQGFLQGEWRISDKRRRAKFYDITREGKAHLKHELERWSGNTAAIGRVLGVERPAG